VVIVVDAFRASTTIAVLVSKGAKVVPVASVEEASSAETDFRIGERGSAKVAGFDFGNSPTEILGSEVPPGSTLALSTTNGTRVVKAARGARAILAGAFVNAGILAEGRPTTARRWWWSGAVGRVAAPPRTRLRREPSSTGCGLVVRNWMGGQSVS
jgi:2-phosphosulfolactate phosphatase